MVMVITGGFSWIDVLKYDDTKDNKRPRDWEKEWGKTGWSKDIIESYRTTQKNIAEEIKAKGTLMADLVEEHKAIVDKCCRNTKVFYMRNLLSSKVWNRPVHEPGIGTTVARRKGRNKGTLGEQQLSDWSLSLIHIYEPKRPERIS